MMARVLLALGFVAMSGLTSAQAQEPGWITSDWQVEAARPTWSDQSVNRNRTASGLNLSLAWPAGASVGSRGPAGQRLLDPRVRIVSCYEAAQALASNDIYGGTFGHIEGARNLGSILDSQYARNRRGAQFDACTNANR